MLSKEEKDESPDNSVPENPLEALVNKERFGSEESDKPTKSENDSKAARFKRWYLANKKLSIPAAVLLLLLFLAAVPWTRYKTAAILYKKDFTLQLRDATAKTPISGANVAVGGTSGITDGNGRVTLKNIKVGSHKALVTKKYYREASIAVLVPILGQKSTPSFTLSATGRLVKVTLQNIISRQKLSGVSITAGDVEAKTDKLGSAVLVLPVGTTSQKATLSAKGYNRLDVQISVSQQEIKDNKFNLTPAGKIYFLSKKSGNIDLVKTNLDGSERQTVLAGTGKEEEKNTILLASSDWKYLALLSRRDSSQPKLYMVETDDDSISTMDEGNIEITPVGWNEDKFIFRVDRRPVKQWQPKKYALKSYNAAKRQLLTLDESAGEGTSDDNAAFESINNIYSVDNFVVYSKSWTSYDFSNDNKYQGKQDGIYQINNDGTARRAVNSFNHDSGNRLYLESYLYRPRAIYYSLVDGSAPPKYFEYKSGKLSDRGDLSDEFRKYKEEDTRTYLLSPSGELTFWSEERDGKSALLLGDKEGENGKEVLSLSDEYRVYGWFGEDYLLVSKKSSEIYILPKSGAKDESQLLKITDYQKPSASFFNYGAYGGL